MNEIDLCQACDDAPVASATGFCEHCDRGHRAGTPLPDCPNCRDDVCLGPGDVCMPLASQVTTRPERTAECERCGATKAANALTVCGWCPPGFHPFDEGGAFSYEFLASADGNRTTLDVGHLWCRHCGREGVQTVLFGLRGVAAVVYQCGHWQHVHPDWE